MNNKFVLGIGFLGVACWFLLRNKSEEPRPIAQNPSKKLESVLPSDKQKGSMIQAEFEAKMMHQQRVFKAEQNLGIIYYKPKIELDNFILTLRYSAIERMCVNGDIDLIRRAIDPGQQLLWILEDSDSKTISFSRSVSAADLALDFIQTIKIPVTQEPRYYRLALCSSQSTRSCAGTQAFDFDKIQDTKVKQAAPVKNGLFFSQNLRIDATGLRLFDSREVGNDEDYILYASEADGNTKASKFISEMVEQKKLMRPLPARLDKDGLHINLYVRNNKDCK